MNSRYTIDIRNENNMNNDNMNGNLKKTIPNGIRIQLRNVRGQNKGRNIGNASKEKPENTQGKERIEIGYININGLNITSTIDLEEERKEHELEIASITETHLRNKSKWKG